MKKISNKWFSFLVTFKKEIGKIEWTNKLDLLFYTKIVLVSVFVFGMSIYVVDLIIGKILRNFTVIMNKFFG